MLVINKADLEKIVSHAARGFPNEVCGILTGRRRRGAKLVEGVHEITNVLSSPFRYEMDPEEQLRVFEEAEAKSLEVLGFYHSHPYSDASPSAVDRSLASYRGLSYVIYSIPTKSVASFVWNGESFEAEEVRVVAGNRNRLFPLEK
ncbi:TPA: M67 family peptidase [Candidatus Bathyarchaeota archaeon]|nr:M67 family peptidase [Candidatus Bathyarchaeota archaeon]